MGNFKQKYSSKGGRDNRDDRQMHNATCADCGRDCKIPFKPTSDKPIYCSDCFTGDRNPKGGRDRDRGRGRGRDRDRGRDNRGDRQMHSATCADCGKHCEVPFKPTGGKPVLCSICFSKGEGSGRSDKSGKKHNEMSAKLDKIISLLEKLIPAEKAKAIKEVKEEKVAKPKKAAKKAPAKKKAVAKKAPAKKKAAQKKKVAAKKPAAKKKAPAKKKAKK